MVKQAKISATRRQYIRVGSAPASLLTTVAQIFTRFTRFPRLWLLIGNRPQEAALSNKVM